MIRFQENVNIVVSTLEKYRYGPRAIRFSRDCYNSLKTSMETERIKRFSVDYAFRWLEGITSNNRLGPYRMAILRLDDVYRQGRVSGAHLIVYSHPSEHFRRHIEEYLSDKSSSGEYSDAHLENMRHAVTQFLCFVQYDGTESVACLDYPVLDRYCGYLAESSRAHNINEGLVSGFLKHLAEKGECPPGLYLYMHYNESGKCLTMAGLGAEAAAFIHDIKEESLHFPANEFYNSIPGFSERLRKAGYSKTVTDSAPYHLTLFYIFIDREGMGYDYGIVSTWLKEFGLSLFSSGLPMARRTFEMYEDYRREGDIVPEHYWKHGETDYDRLPDWCRKKLAPFIESRQKEGWSESTIKMYRTCCTRFCMFLVDSGIDSFSGVTPEAIKLFNKTDIHGTTESKNAYNSRIRKFLIHLEFDGAIPYGIHHALPHGSAPGARIVETLPEGDLDKIRSYCASASTPLEIRDAAMLMTALETGFRSCDIAGLGIRDIDWKEKCINIIQKKTGARHIHPVSTRVCNALFRYLRDVRRRGTGNEALFLEIRAPYGRVGSSACGDAMIRAGASSRKTHLMRKSYGSGILNSGATVEETAEMLGHADSSNVHKYTLLDSERMRLCPLSLSETGLSVEGRYGS